MEKTALQDNENLRITFAGDYLTVNRLGMSKLRHDFCETKGSNYKELKVLVSLVWWFR